MKTLNKFILQSYLGPMVMTFFIVTFILMLNFLWLYIDELVGKGLPFIVVVEFIFYATSTLIPMGLPLSTLLAAIMTMGNMGENNELLALKAAGISLPKIIKPVFIMAIFISIASFFIINNYVPYSYLKMSTLLYDIRQQRQHIEFKDGVFFDGIPDVAIRVGKQDPVTKLLENILIYDTRNIEAPNTIVADSGYISLTNNKEFLQVKLFDGHTYEGNRTFSWYTAPTLRHHEFDNQEILIELEGFNFERSDDSFAGGGSMALNINELDLTIDSLSIATSAKLLSFSDAVTRKYLFVRDTSIMNMTDSISALKHKVLTQDNIMFDTLSIKDKSKVLDGAATTLNNIKYFASSEHNNIRSSSILLYLSLIDYHKKLSLPVSVIIFFLIGASLGAIISKGGFGVPIIISVLFFVIYYIITLTGEKMVRDGAWDAISGVWLSSFILGPLALFLTYKSTTDSTLLDIDSYKRKIKKVVLFINNLKHLFKSNISTKIYKYKDNTNNINKK